MDAEPKPPQSSLPAHLEARVDAIIRAAEDHAQSIQRDIQVQQRVAESEAQRHVLDARRQADALTDDRLRRLHELTGELTERAEATLRQFEGFAEALERATRQLEAEGIDAGGPPSVPRPPSVRRPPAPAPTAVPEPSPHPRRMGYAAKRAASRAAELDAARLVAIEMAVDGHARADVENHLSQQFSIGGVGAMLDDVFGSATGPTRARWRDDD